MSKFCLENFAYSNFTKFWTRFHRMRGGNSSAPSFSASLCSLCTENNSLASVFMFSLSLTCVGFKSNREKYFNVDAEAWCAQENL